MAKIDELQEKYENLDNLLPVESEDSISPECLLSFDYEYPDNASEIIIDSDEFTAICPWTSLPDIGTLTINYIPDRSCIELKSLKYYLLSYRQVGIVQEHAATRILNDLVGICLPLKMEVTLDYKIRGGLHTTVTSTYVKPSG